MPTIDPIVVIGGGHAGVEAAHAAARMGMRVRLLTLRADALARLSCNPAIGGIGKSHLVREVDAMGGLIARAADEAGIHFRVLNRSRGPAVQGPRVQQDESLYPATIRRLLLEDALIEVHEGEAVGFEVAGDAIRAVRTDSEESLPCSAVVLTTGTFLQGRLYRGEDVVEGGRRGEPAAVRMADQLRAVGLEIERFKTGTPPRVARESVDTSRLSEQPGDGVPVALSFANLTRDRFQPAQRQAITHLAYTNGRTHDVVRRGLDRSPLYTGRIASSGPRYCPSFEDKVVRFPDREAHLIHVEPMGLNHPWLYLNGLSTSLPSELQRDLVRSIPGFEAAKIMRDGYAVEYDFVPPHQLDRSLAVRGLSGLFLAGQICGTTGYEEAAALGLVAGINAAQHAIGKEPWHPSRLESYIGVMVDDLTGTGVLEPYRMFTSRAELRLSLSPDTADQRLTPQASALGVVSREQAARAEERWDRISRGLEALDFAGDLQAARPRVPADRIRRGEDPSAILSDGFPEAATWCAFDRETLVSSLRYRGYLDIERREADKLRRAESVAIPESLDYSELSGLSREVSARLAERRPETLGQAARIPGVTPAAVALLAAAISATRRQAS